jgi:hypothetical protein
MVKIYMTIILPILYECEAWSVIQWEDDRVCKQMLRRIFGLVIWDVTGASNLFIPSSFSDATQAMRL